MYIVQEYLKGKKGKVYFETENLWEAMSACFKYRKHGYDVVISERREI